MGYTLFLGVMMWTVLVLSAIHVACASEAASAVTSLQCTGSACGTETVQWTIFRERALVAGRKLLTTKELDVTKEEKSSADVTIAEVPFLGKRKPRGRMLAAVPPPPRVAPVGRTPWVVVPPSPPSGSKKKRPISPAPTPGTPT